TIAKDHPGFLRLVPVAFHHLRTADRKLADVALRQFSRRVVPSTTFASVSGNGMPMHSLTTPFRGLQWVTGDASVRPYPSTSRPPVAASNCFRTSFGRGAAPEMHARIDRRSYFASFGCRRIAMYIVGTPGKRLGFVLLISLRIAPISRGFG